MNVLEILLNRRWILKSRDRELYYQVKEKLASGEEKKFLREKLGYQVIVNPYLIKVEKMPAVPENWMTLKSLWSMCFFALYLCFWRRRKQKNSLCCLSLQSMYRVSMKGSRLTGRFIGTAVI